LSAHQAVSVVVLVIVISTTATHLYVRKYCCFSLYGWYKMARHKCLLIFLLWINTCWFVCIYLFAVLFIQPFS